MELRWLEENGEKRLQYFIEGVRVGDMGVWNDVPTVQAEKKDEWCSCMPFCTICGKTRQK